MKKITRLFHQQRRRFGQKTHFHFDPCFFGNSAIGPLSN
jgi:hypothetical protein